MADIDSILAGTGGNTRVDFSGIGDLPKAYWEGLDQRAKNDLRNAFKPTAENPNGVPMKDGQIDIPTVMKTLFQKGDIAGGTNLLGTAQAAQDRTDYYKSLDPQGPQTSQQPNIASPPSASAPRLKEVAAPLNRGGVQGPGQSPQGDQPGSIVGLVSAAGIPDELAGPVIQQVSAMSKMDPNAALDPATSQRVQQVVQAHALRMKGGQQPQPSGLAPQPSPQMQPQMAQAPQGFQPSPAQVAAQNDPELKRAKYFAASRDKAIAASALATQKSIEDSRQPTTEMKNSAAPGLLERQGEQAAQQAGAVEAAKGYVEKYKNIDEAGTKAIQEIPKLQLALKQMDSPDFQSGSGQRFDLAYRRLAVRMGGDPDKAAPQEIVSKVVADSILNGLGSLKGLGPIRVAEMNLARTAAMSMDNTPQTNKFLANVAIRIQQRAVEVSDMAQNYNDGVLDVGFDKKLREMDKNKPLFTPDEVQRFQKIIGGEEKQPKQGTQPANQQAAAPTAFPNAQKAPDGNWYVVDQSRGMNPKTGKPYYNKVVQ